MKVTSKQLALLAAILAIVFGGAGRTSAAETTAVSKPELEANIKYCEICHGHSAEGFRGYYPIPRLAGQTPDFLTYALQAFVERRRTNNIMFHVASSLSPGMQTALAAHFHDLIPSPSAARQRTSWPQERKFSKKKSPPGEAGALSRAAPATESPPKQPGCSSAGGSAHDFIVDKLTFSTKRLTDSVEKGCVKNNAAYSGGIDRGANQGCRGLPQQSAIILPLGPRHEARHIIPGPLHGSGRRTDGLKFPICPDRKARQTRTALRQISGFVGNATGNCDRCVLGGGRRGGHQGVRILPP